MVNARRQAAAVGVGKAEVFPRRLAQAGMSEVRRGLQDDVLPTWLGLRQASIFCTRTAVYATITLCLTLVGEGKQPQGVVVVSPAQIPAMPSPARRVWQRKPVGIIDPRRAPLSVYVDVATRDIHRKTRRCATATGIT